MNANSIFSRDPATYSEHPEQFKWMQADLTNPLTCIASIIKGDDKIVDIGCGAGLLGRYLSKIYPSVHISGIDPSIEAGHLGIAPYRHFFSGGLEDALDFDWVKDAGWYIFADVIEHLVYPDLMLKQLVEKSPQSANFVFSVPNVGYFANRLDLLFGNWEYSDSGIKEFTHLRFLTLKTALKILNSAGLHIQSISFLNRIHSPEPFKNYGTFKMLLASLMMKSNTNPLAYQFVIVASKRSVDHVVYKNYGSNSRFLWIKSLFATLIKKS